LVCGAHNKTFAPRGSRLFWERLNNDTTLSVQQTRVTQLFLKPLLAFSKKAPAISFAAKRRFAIKDGKTRVKTFAFVTGARF
jgi:hypothetical protein